MAKEIWQPIIGYENEYEVSNLGRIKSLLFNKEKILKTRRNCKGYELVNLRGTTYRVHTLVAKAFVENPFGFTEVNHKNEIKYDNRAINLEWCNRKYNCNYGSFPQKTSKRFSKKIAIVDENGKQIISFSSAMSAEIALKIDHSSIIKCCKNKMKTAGGYHWVYVSEKRGDLNEI